MRARYYNPVVGRFLIEDPIWSTNLYTYSGNNPVNNIDVNGKNPVLLALVTVVFVDGLINPDAQRPWDDAINFADDVGMAMVGTPVMIIPYSTRGLRIVHQAGRNLRKSNIVNVAEGGILRIQNAANKINKPIHLVGNRANGTSNVLSDFDYVIEGVASKDWNKIKNSIPGAKIMTDNVPRRIDLFRGKLDRTKPYITIYPHKK